MAALLGFTGMGLIAKERTRQIVQEGYTPEHDDEHSGELVEAAIAYAAHARYKRHVTEAPNDWWPSHWDFNPSPDPIRNLVKAGALIAAEIDRLQREAQS